MSDIRSNAKLTANFGFTRYAFSLLPTLSTEYVPQTSRRCCNDSVRPEVGIGEYPQHLVEIKVRIS
jgi:hypothetical protein